MKTVLLLILLMVSTGCARAPVIPSHEELRGMALRLVFDGGKVWGICGGSPVAADTLRTAKHCLDGKALVSVGDAVAGTYSVREVGKDVIEIKFAKPMFKRWLKLGKVKQGDRIRWWGNPKGIVDVYREGRVAAAHGPMVAVDAMVCKGDSGSGLVNDAGELVAVLSMQQPEQGECMFALGES